MREDLSQCSINNNSNKRVKVMNAKRHASTSPSHQLPSLANMTLTRCRLECKSKRNAAGLSATIAFTPSDCRRFPAGPVAFSRTGRARNAPKHGIRASAGHAHASPAQSFAGLSATPVRFSLPGRFFRLFSPVNYLLPPSRDGFRTTSSGLIRTIPSSPSRSLGRSLEAACRGVFPPRLLLG